MSGLLYEKVFSTTSLRCKLRKPVSLSTVDKVYILAGFAVGTREVLRARELSMQLSWLQRVEQNEADVPGQAVWLNSTSAKWSVLGACIIQHGERCKSSEKAGSHDFQERTSVRGHLNEESRGQLAALALESVWVARYRVLHDQAEQQGRWHWPT